MLNEVFYLGDSLPLVLCDHVHTKEYFFMGAIYLLIWVLGNPLGRERERERKKWKQKETKGKKKTIMKAT
jgi:hypothetical protein